MKLEDKPSIIIYRKNQKYRFRLVCVNNDEPLATCTRGYRDPDKLLVDLQLLKVPSERFGYTEKIGSKYYFKVFLPNLSDTSYSQILRSEPYTTHEKAIEGYETMRKALRRGLLTNESSEDTSIVHIDSPNALEVIRCVYT